jgi:hypothetical protein
MTPAEFEQWLITVIEQNKKASMQTGNPKGWRQIYRGKVEAYEMVLEQYNKIQKPPTT